MAKVTELERIFMEFEGMTAAEAAKKRQEMTARVAAGEDPEEVLYEEGLEPDYVFDILPAPKIVFRDRKGTVITSVTSKF